MWRMLSTQQGTQMTTRSALRRRLIGASVLLLVALAGVNAPVLAQGKETFTFGVALPTTGPAAPFGLDQIQALEWAIADINASGGAAGRTDPRRIDVPLLRLAAHKLHHAGAIMLPAGSFSRDRGTSGECGYR